MKVVRHIFAIAGRIVFVGLSIQIVLGLLWMCCNFTGMQQFGESQFYIEASKSFLCDEYTGALYPALLMLTRGIEDVLRIPHTYIVYLLQVGLAGYAGYNFFEFLKNRIMRIWASLVLLTFPMAMQCHMAVLPNSLAASLFLLEMTYVLRAFRRKEALQAVDLAKANTCWLLAALLLPEYLYLGAVPVILVFLYEIMTLVSAKKNGANGPKRGKSIVYHGILIVAFIGMIAGANSLTQEPGCYNRPEKSLNAALFRRTVWTSITDYYAQWPEDMRACFTEEEVKQIGVYADNMERILQPRLEMELGVERANVIYQELGAYIWEQNTSKIVHQTAWDAVGYSLPTMTVQLLLAGRGYDSYLGRNYDVMRQEAPKLTGYYMDYSCWWFMVGVVLAVVLLPGAFGNKKKIAKTLLPTMVCVVSAGCMVIWYTLQGAGVWDYKNALFVGQLWLIGMMVVAERNLHEA